MMSSPPRSGKAAPTRLTGHTFAPQPLAQSTSSQASTSSAILTQVNLLPANAPPCIFVLISGRCRQVGAALERDPAARPSSSPSSPLASLDPLASQLLLLQLQQQRQIMIMLERQQQDAAAQSPRQSIGSSPMIASLPSPRSFLPQEPSSQPHQLPVERATHLQTQFHSAEVPIVAPPTRVHGRNKKVKGGVKVHKSNEAGVLLDPKGHPAMQSAASLQIAIRHCTRSQRGAADDGALSYDKYVEFDKIMFPAAGCAETGTPAHGQPDFKMKDYCPAVFKELRCLFGVSENDYLDSLCKTDPQNPNVPSLRVMGSPGKSGSMFFFSTCLRFIVKTIPKMEAKQLRDLLPA